MPGNKIITNAKDEVPLEETTPHGPPSELVLGLQPLRTRAEGAPAPWRVTRTRISEQRQQQESDSKSPGIYTPFIHIHA